MPRAEFHDLQARRFDDVALVPAQLSTEWSLGHRLGAYDGSGEPLDDVLIERYHWRSEQAPIQPPIGPPVPEAVYGGFLLPHFGHFLLETLARMWWIRAHPAERVVWHGLTRELADWQVDIFALLGVTVRPSDVALAPLGVRRLTIPQAGFAIGHSFHPAHVAALGVVPFGEPTPGRRIWLSRSSLANRRVIGEPELEERLRAFGWEILAPETLAIPEQLETLSRAEMIAGFEGSGFHLLILGRDVRAKVRIIHRGRQVLPPVYEEIARAKAIEQESLYVEMDEISALRTAATSLRLRDHGPILRFVES